MIETEQSKLISDDQLLQGIQLTERELEAYRKLSEGFRTLATLPENAGANANMHNFHAGKYEGLATECSKFLHQLCALKAERENSAS